MKNLFPGEMIRKNIQGRKVLILFILTNLVYLLMLTITIPGVMAFSGGMKLLDMMPGGYSSEYVSKLLNALGEEGRHAYLFTQLPLDMIYPLLFGITYPLVIAYFLNKMGKGQSLFLYLCLVPLLAGLFDYSENIGIIAMLNTYPNNPAALSSITNVFSVSKSIFTTASFLTIIILIGIFFIRYLLQVRKIKR